MTKRPEKLKIVIVAGPDPTSSAVFRAVTLHPAAEIRAVFFSRSMMPKTESFTAGVIRIFRRTGLQYFLYAAIWSGVFLCKEKLALRFPRVVRLLSSFYSLRIWAVRQGIVTDDILSFNDPAFLRRLAELAPDIVFVRVGEILKEPFLGIPRLGCWCVHSSLLPAYRGVAPEFHGMLRDESLIGTTVMMTVKGLDRGPIIAQASRPVRRGESLHSMIERNAEAAHEAITAALDDAVNQRVSSVPQPSTGGSYFTWPGPEDVRQFKKKGKVYITLRELVRYVLQ